MEESKKYTHFGFRTVQEHMKSALVGDVFKSVASRYDRMNDGMSLGIHRLWKEALIDWMMPRAGMSLLDVAGGTGDIALRYLTRLQGEGSVVVCDFTSDMIQEGRRRPEFVSYEGKIDWVCGDAMCLPFPTGHFDFCTIAFGIRNVTHIEKALSEIYRVLRPGGRFLCLEFSRVLVPALARLYDFYSFNVIPLMGQVIAKDRDSYQYLVESIRKFPDQESFRALIQEAGFLRVRYRNLTGGIAAIHSGWRL